MIREQRGPSGPASPAPSRGSRPDRASSAGAGLRPGLKTSATTFILLTHRRPFPSWGEAGKAQALALLKSGLLEKGKGLRTQKTGST